MTRSRINRLTPSALFLALAFVGCSSSAEHTTPSEVRALKAATAASLVPYSLTEEAFAASFVGDTDELQGRGLLLDGRYAAFVIDGDYGTLKGRRPSDLEQNLAVILLHARNGLGETDRRWAKRLAAHGYAVIIPNLGRDLHAPGAPTTPTEFGAIEAAIEYARNDLEIRARQVILLGFRDGAAHALRVGALNGSLEGVIAYAPPKGVPHPIAVPTVVFDTDGAIVNEPTNMMVVAVEADAAFADPNSPAYHPPSAKNAWHTVRAFLSSQRDPHVAVID